MSAIVLGVVIDESDAKLLYKMLKANDSKTKYLTPGKFDELEIPILNKLVASDFINKTPAKGKTGKDRYSISTKGIEAYQNLPTELKEIASKKKVSSSKSKKRDEIAALNVRLDSIEKKIDQILNILTNLNQGNGKNAISNNGDKLESFKRSLVEEYKKLVSREFLSDGKVWHDQLKHIVMDRYGYKDYEYDELLQHLKETSIGMVSISQGKEKTWIEIRA